MGSKPAVHLPTPEDGCGLTKVKNTRIVGGSVAPVGAWPWFALLGYNEDDENDFKCGKHKTQKYSFIKYLFIQKQ